MRFRCCLGMIWSVSMFSRCSGATTPRCLRIGSMLVPVLPSADVDKVSFDSGGGGGGGADQMRTPLTPLSAFEVAVTGRGAALFGLEDIGVHAETHRASGLTPLGSGFFEDTVKALLLGGNLHCFRAGDNQYVHTVMNFVAAHHPGSGAQVFQASIGAGTDEDAV